LYPRVYNLFSLLDAAALGDEGFNSGDSRDDHDPDYGNSGDRDSRDGSSMGQVSGGNPPFYTTDVY
jgi:hypothetical protein